MAQARKKEAKKQESDNQKAQVGDAANQLLEETKKLANELYQDTLKKVGDAQHHAKDYSDDLLKKVEKNPLKSILIAGGIGFLLSTLLRK